MIFEKVQSLAENYLNEAKGKFVLNDSPDPLIFGISGSKITTHPIVIQNEESRGHIPVLLNKMAKIYDAIIIIIDIRVIETYEDTNLEKIENTTTDPDISEALACFIYTEKKSMIRILRYFPDVQNSFFDGGWEKLANDCEGRFLNPFNQNKYIESL